MATPITFNVVFTPGSVRRQLPFAVSLLRGSGVSVRLVGNGCDAEERALLSTASALDERLSHHDLPLSQPLSHGEALNGIFTHFGGDDPFAIADFDVVASGDFVARLLPLEPGQAAVFTAPPVWLTEDDGTAPEVKFFSSGRHRVLADGTPVGGTFVAIYDRRALEGVWPKAPRGFSVHQAWRLPQALRDSLAERGWLYRMYDTCRLVNFLLLLSGFSLENRPAPELHHVGGLSATTHGGLRAQVRGILALARSDEPFLAGVVERGAARLSRARENRRPHRRAANQRRGIVQAHVEAVVDALLAGEPRPAAPETGSTEVDQSLAALVAALEGVYAPPAGTPSSLELSVAELAGVRTR